MNAGGKIPRRLAAAFIAAIAMSVAGSIFPAPARAASLPQLAITSPASGTQVSPGSSVTVDVTATGKGKLARGVGLVGQNGLGAAGPVLMPPYTFTLQIPSTLAPGKYGLTAFGASKDGSVVTSAPITLDVELLGAPLTLLVSPPRLFMEAIGERLPLTVAGNFSGGATSDLTGSSGLSLTSQNPAIASVDSTGMIRAVGAGTTTIMASVSGGPSTPVAVQVIAPAITPSATDIDFGSTETGGAGVSQQLTLNNTDSAPVAISGLQTSEGFSETDNCVSSSPIASGGSCQATITFVPTAQGAAQGTIDISNDAVIVPTTVYLSGTGTSNSAAIARVRPAKLKFGRVHVGKTRRRAFTIRNKGTATLHVFVTMPADPFAVSGQTATVGTNLVQIDVAPRHRARLRIAFAPMAARPFSGVLKVTTNDPNAAEIDVPMTGRGR